MIFVAKKERESSLTNPLLLSDYIISRIIKIFWKASYIVFYNK